jgi:hypothetical protein
MVIFFLQGKAQGRNTGPAAGAHRIGKNERNLKLNLRYFSCSILALTMPISAIGLNDGNYYQDWPLRMALMRTSFPAAPIFWRSSHPPCYPLFRPSVLLLIGTFGALFPP